MNYEIYDTVSGQALMEYGLDDEVNARNFLAIVAQQKGYAVEELAYRPRAKRAKVASFTFENIPVGTCGNERQKAFLRNRTGVVPYSFPRKHQLLKMLVALNAYNREIGELRLKPVEITDDGAKFRALAKDPATYEGGWTVWLECYDLRALMAFGRELERIIFS